MIADEADDQEEQDWTAGLDQAVRPYISAEWEQYLRSVRNRVPSGDQIWRVRQIVRDLFDALHCTALSSFAKEEERPRFYWHHQAFDLFRTEDATRGFDIDRGALLSVASNYLSKPEIRTDRLDWILLDAIVFHELDAYAHHVFTTRAGTGLNWAAAFSPRNQLQYFALSVLFWIVGILLRYAAPLALAYYLYIHEHPTGAIVTVGIWALLAIWRAATAPFRWRARRRARKLLQHLGDLYAVLGSNTISPTLWKKMLEAAVADGVVLDGAVFTIIDRAIARDATAFLPHQPG
jgi:hypothetical protein